MVTGCAFGASATFSPATHIIPAKIDDHIKYFFFFGFWSTNQFVNKNKIKQTKEITTTGLVYDTTVKIHMKHDERINQIVRLRGTTTKMARCFFFNFFSVFFSKTTSFVVSKSVKHK